MKTRHTSSFVLLVLSLSSAAFARQPAFYMPGTIYAMPGIECNIYYKNIIQSVVPQNFSYQAQSKVGTAKLNRWHWTPKAKDAGTTNALVINAWNDSGIVCAITTKVVVAAAPKDPKKTVRFALFADSLTNSGYQKVIYQDMLAAGCTNFTPVGSRRARKGEKGVWVPHDGIPGYTCSQFLVAVQVTEDELAKAVGTPAYELYKRLGKPRKIGGEDAEYDRQWVRSPLVKEDQEGKPVLNTDGTPVVDVQQWIDRYSGGKAPDVLMVQLGVNDVFWLKGEQEKLRKDIRIGVMPWYVKFYKALRAKMPKTRIVFTTQPLGSDQDGFGENYGSDWNEIQHRKIIFALNKETEKFVTEQNDPNLRLLSVAQAVDPFYGLCYWNHEVNARSKERKLRTTNAVHVNGTGGAQMADTMAAWTLAHWDEFGE